MSKTKKKSHDEVEFLKGKIRELQTENRQLKRELKSLRVSKHRLRELEDTYSDIDLQIIEPKQDTTCEVCGKGTMEDKVLPFGLLKICNLCSNRKIIKKDNGGPNA